MLGEAISGVVNGLLSKIQLDSEGQGTKIMETNCMKIMCKIINITLTLSFVLS